MIDKLEFDSKVEAIARLMCRELGLNPDDVVDTWDDEIRTPDEEQQFPCLIIPTVHNPGVAPPYEVAAYGYRPHMHRPRWFAYRKQAAIAWASWKAVNEYALTQSP